MRQSVEDIYPLSPMQRGLLFHTLYAPESGTYFEQHTSIIQGNLNVSAFKQAWQKLLERHSILRTAFVWKDVKEPLQVVHREPKLPWEEMDWCGLSSVEQKKNMESFLLEDRKRGFDLSSAPLMRFFLIRLTPVTYHFIWSFHHMLLDGWSVALIYEEVLNSYKALFKGTEWVPKNSPPPYREYIAWLRKQDTRKAEAFWRQELKGFDVPSQLPRTHVATIHSASEKESHEQRIDLSPQATAALKSVAQKHHLTLNTICQGAWAVLLGRYCGQEDVLFGSTVAGRPPDLPGVESMVGLFINTLPVRVRISGKKSINFWLKNLQEGQLQSRQFEYSSLVDIQGWSEIPRGQALFDNILIFENYPSNGSLAEQDIGIKIHGAQLFEKTNYPLTLTIFLNEDQLNVSMAYDTELFDKSTIERMIGHFQVLLEGIAANPEQRLSELLMLTQAEKQQLLVEWNDTKADYPKDKCVHQLFEEQAGRTPDAVAVEYEDQSLSYMELNQRANQLAHHLRSMGVGPDVLVGICVERSLEMVVGLLGILKAGGAYVPLDPAYPKERLAFMLHDSGAKVLLTPKKPAGNSWNKDVTRLVLDDQRGAIAREKTENPRNAAQQGNLAYVIYTSGSTGRPKGVAMVHSGLSDLIYWHKSGIKNGLTTAQFSSISFDVSVEEIFTTLCEGGCLVLIPEDKRLEASGLLEFIMAKKIERIDLPMIVLEQLAETAVSRNLIPASLRFVITGSEQVRINSGIKAFFDRLNGCDFENQYGPTEAHVLASAFNLSGFTKNWPTLPPIGRPITNTTIYLLDSTMRPVPIGVGGELFIGGAGLARGYLNRPDLTAEKFIPNPFSAEPGARLYKTGDLARYMPNGDIEYIGRIDNQVKIRGFRIELGEIESVLSQYPGVKETIVLAREDVAGDKRLVAYVVGQEGSGNGTGRGDLGTGSLRSYLKEKLPDYMVPSAFVFLEKLPLTSNGKIDRRTLPVPDRNRELEGYVAPRNEPEKLLAGIWVKVLNLERVGIHDNFFELGGHSLLATQIASRVRDVFKVELPLRKLFEKPTIAGLNSEIEALQNQGDKGLASEPIVPVPREGELPLSYAQERLWFLSELEPNNAFYNIPLAMRLTGKLDVGSLERSIGEIIRRHEALRTTFVSHDGRPVQVIGPPGKYSLPVVDLTELSVSEREAKVLRLAQEDVGRPFDLAKGPLVRASLLKLSKEEHVLLWNMHHVVSDGWSFPVLYRELAVLYEAYSAGKPSPLPELPIQYADFAMWQRKWLRGEVLENQLSYWKERLNGLPTLQLPTDRPRPPIQTRRGAYRNFELPKIIADKIEELSRQKGVTKFMLLLAAFKLLLSKYSGQEDILVGTPIANRNRSEVEGLIGFFVNTLVLRTDLSGDPTLLELIARVGEVALGAYAHQDLPFEKLVEELKPERDMSRSPLFQVMFLGGEEVLSTAMELPGLTLAPLADSGETSKFDLTLFVEAGNKNISGSIEYNTDLFDGTTIDRMIGHFKVLLEAIVANPEQRLSELSMLTESEKHQLLVEWNDTKKDYPEDKCVHQLFEEQVERTPDAVAVVFEDQQLTYRELNQRANQLAHHLRSLGVGPDVLVGICVERSLEMVVGLLGILKAGGAYVPLDPAYPKERLAFMLEDSRVKVVLSKTKLLALLPQGGVEIIALGDKRAIALESKNNPKNTAVPRNLAYIIYTSGSTGKPKGVEIPHLGIIRLLFGGGFAILDEKQVLLQFAPIAFDASTLEIWGALLHGGTCVLFNGAKVNAFELSRVLKRHMVTTAWLTSSFFNAIMDEAPEELASLRQLLVGGEALSVPHIRRALEALPQSQLINGYGPTESTTFTCTYSIPRYSDAVSMSIPIGRPIGNTQVYLLNKDLQPVPIGVCGELCIGGEGLARGYLNRPDLTAEKFVPNHFSEDPGARLYKTGDLARYLPDGNIEYLGRIDNQVKIRGFRIELGEIESVLRQHPSVGEAVVLAREDTPGDKRLVAYVVDKAGSEDGTNRIGPEPGALREYLKVKLPDYMVPSAFVLLDKLPMMPNGKIDRRALPVPDKSRELEGYVPPRNEVEKLLAEIWGKVLNLENVGVTDNFFELGGHSLLGVRMIAEIERALGKKLPVAALFQDPTVEKIAARLRKGEKQNKFPSLVAINPKGSRPAFFCVHPIGGNVICYLELAQHLGADQPFYGLQARGVEGDQEPLAEIEVMAAYYIESLRFVQPKGPYCLGGWSFGGVVAFEMARQLQKQDQEVALLALFDSSVPNQNNYNLIDEDGLLEEICFDLARISMAPGSLINELKSAAKSGAEKLKPFLKRIFPSDLPQTTIDVLVKVYKYNYHALNTFKPKAYSGNTVLFLAGDGLKDVESIQREAWGELIHGKMEVYKFPGDHYTMMRDPNVRFLAEKLGPYFMGKKNSFAPIQARS